MTQDNTKHVRRRRRYSAQFKAELVAEFLAGGVSLASLAIGHDINPNILHRWVREHERHGRHRLGDGSNGHADSKPGHAMTPTNWIPVSAPDTVISGRSLASVKSHHPDKTPIHEKPEKAFITIKLAVEPMDMRAGPDTALARVILDFGQAVPHYAYVFANKRANRMKILVHDGFGVWLAARRLNEGGFN